jgi:hypothetical protein
VLSQHTSQLTSKRRLELEKLYWPLRAGADTLYMNVNGASGTALSWRAVPSLYGRWVWVTRTRYLYRQSFVLGVLISIVPVLRWIGVVVKSRCLYCTVQDTFAPAVPSKFALGLFG